MSLVPICDEIVATFNSGIWFPAIATTMLLPDAAGAVDALETKPSRRYIRWYDENVLPVYHGGRFKFDGEVVYKLRNAMIHENVGFTAANNGYDRIIFQPPKQGSVFDFCLSGMGDPPQTALCVQLQGFIQNVTAAALRWEQSIRSDMSPSRRERLERLMHLHPHGVAPHFVGTPFIG